MGNALIIFLGGGIGALTRHFVGMTVTRQVGGSNFPWHTLVINLSGAFLIGLITETMALKANLPEAVRYLAVVGFLGGYTTFSSFSLESSLMLERGDYLACGAYIAASVIGTIALVFAATAAVRALV